MKIMKGKRVNKLLTLLLALVMVVGVFPVSTFAADDTLPAQGEESVDSTETAPTSITIGHNAANVLSDGKLVLQTGDKFKLIAYDQDGKETPVTWSTTANASVISLDQATGEVEVTGSFYTGSTSYLYFTATSTIDPGVSSPRTSIMATGFVFSPTYKNMTVALSTDGQTAKTASLTGGQNGYNIWSYEIPDGVAELAAEPGTSSSIRFNVFRPGTFTVTFKLDINAALTDTATVNVTGVAVEDADGNNTKTYFEIGGDDPNPSKQLTAYVAEGRTVSSWESADTAIAEVSENGLVTAKGIGSTIITATDSEGKKGGIKVVAQSAETPYFESLEFATTAFNSGTWVTGSTFKPTTLEYTLPIRTYSTSSLVLQAATLYNSDRYTAVAEYTDVNGEKQSIPVNNGSSTTLANQPFDDSVLTITLADKNDAENKTVYTFNVSRPRDTTKAIRSSGIVLVPTGRVLSSIAYQDVTEGTMRRAGADGEVTTGTGVTGTQYYYRTFIYDDIQSFTLTLSSSTTYAHVRYSIDNGSSWTETAQGGGATAAIALPESGAEEILIQIIDDAAYAANVKDGKDGFADTMPAEYKVWVDQLTLSAPEMLTAGATGGDWYPAFRSDLNSYWLIVGNTDTAPVLTYTVAEGNTVKIGSNVQSADEDGKYTLTLTTTQTSITVSNEEGFSNTYRFGYKKKSALDVPDKVVDYLCMGSQYTNGNNGVNPETTLAGGLISLGNFGGYVTYYYENPIIDNPNNKYGMDFYVIGNSQESNIDSMAELGQVYVSEDGQNWYALAGSEHYEDKAIWDYTITYTKGDDGKAYWTDNYGNSIDYAAKAWPSASVYYMNDTANQDSYTFKGVLFESQLGSITGDSTSTGSYAAKAKFGYADYYASNVSVATLTDVNSYVENPSKANGFDLAWAVDEDGIPVDVSEKEFHYIRVATASNIYAGAFAEKSTEVTYVARTTAQEEAVGKTAAPTGVTISDGAESKTVNFTEDQNVYSVNLDNMKYISVTVNGTADDDNIYVNNKRVASGTAAEGFKVTKEKGETLVRVIVQNGDKEPVLYLLKLSSNAEESDELIEGIKINANGTVREASTNNGIDYTESVGYTIDCISISPVAGQNVAITVNGEALAESYALEYGSNVFEIVASDTDGNSQTVTLTVTREEAPESSGKTITVYFTLYGDKKHGDDEVHTYKSDKSALPVWIPRTAYTADANATVLDVFQKALTDAGLTWTNAGGNYISQIDGLSEFDNGALSGWMYTMNGAHSDRGLAEQSLNNNDIIVFHYTDDYTKEWEGDTDRAAVEAVEGLIYAIDAPVTLDSEEAIQAAREAYDELTDIQKQSVSNYEILAEAELTLAELKKAEAEAVANIYKNTGKYLSETVTNPAVASVGGEWAIIGLARAGYVVSEGYYETYYQNVVEYVKENINEQEQLHRSKSTENARVILGLTALGYDVTDVAGHDLLMGLTDMTYLKRQGLNGPIWALIAFDSHDYEIPVNADAEEQVTREGLIDYILSQQLSDGSWALSGTTTDLDVSAMAVQALAEYYDSNADVKAAVDRTLVYLSNVQMADGGYSGSMSGANSESCAQVIVALTALGIDPTVDSRFIKNGNSVMDALLSFYVEEGGFRHVSDGGLDMMASEQSYYTLVSYYRYLNGQTRLYDMGDVEINGNSDDPYGYYYGDVDKNGIIDATDALIILKHAAQLEMLADELELNLADVDHNNIIDASDALIVLKIAAQLANAEIYSR